MDKNTPLSSLPSSEHEMESKGKDMAKNKVEKDPLEPSIQAIMNIKNYSKSLHVEQTKSVLQFVEYIKN
ncbi:MAG TPA: hypothetical protein VK808_04485 [Bacteroidia bacterium]|jgi:hypothetical protein|nr:hypothetical protein [Bacteroidia bacterium]